jgi:hypothetical protein
MVLSINIPPQIETRLRRQAEAAGKDVGTYVSELVEQAAVKPSLDEVLASVRKEFAATGISDDELIRDLTDAQAEHRAEKHKKTA